MIMTDFTLRRTNLDTIQRALTPPTTLLKKTLVNEILITFIIIIIINITNFIIINIIDIIINYLHDHQPSLCHV